MRIFHELSHVLTGDVETQSVGSGANNQIRTADSRGCCVASPPLAANACEVEPRPAEHTGGTAIKARAGPT
jgi:hypothetical protein